MTRAVDDKGLKVAQGGSFYAQGCPHHMSTKRAIDAAAPPGKLQRSDDDASLSASYDDDASLSADEAPPPCLSILININPGYADEDTSDISELSATSDESDISELSATSDEPADADDTSAAADEPVIAEAKPAPNVPVAAALPAAAPAPAQPAPPAPRITKPLPARDVCRLGRPVRARDLKSRPSMVLKFTKDISRADYMTMCAELSGELSRAYGEPISVQPEPITEGGFRFFGGRFGPAAMPYNISQHAYKSMRHKIEPPAVKLAVRGRLLQQPQRPPSPRRWPHISASTAADWVDDHEVLIAEGCMSHTIIKAANGAPMWSQDEIELFAAVLTSHGVKCTYVRSH